MTNRLTRKKLYIPALILAVLLVSFLFYRNPARMTGTSSQAAFIRISSGLFPLPAIAPGMKNILPQILSIPPNASVLKCANQDLYGDKRQENIIFYLQNDKNSYPAALHLLVDGQEKVSNNLVEGYTTGRLEFEDLDRDGAMEVLVYQCCTGSSAAVLLNIYKPYPNSWKLIFSAPQIPFALGEDTDTLYSVKYLGNYRVGFIDQRSGLQATIRLNPADYSNAEDELEEMGTWVDPISNYVIKDIKGDPCREIVTVQIVCGICHADLIAELNTTYKMINGGYQPVSLSLTAPGNRDGEGLVLAEIDVNNKNAVHDQGRNKMKPYRTVFPGEEKL